MGPLDLTPRQVYCFRLDGDKVRPTELDGCPQHRIGCHRHRANETKPKKKDNYEPVCLGRRRAIRAVRGNIRTPAD